VTADDIHELVRAIQAPLYSTSRFAPEMTATDALMAVAHGLHEIARALDRLGERTTAPPSAVERSRRRTPTPDGPPTAWVAR
jgi:hypothetical protein